MTLHCTKTGATTRAKAETAARRATAAHNFPEWTCIEVKKSRMTPDLCVVVGSVDA